MEQNAKNSLTNVFNKSEKIIANLVYANKF